MALPLAPAKAQGRTPLSRSREVSVFLAVDWNMGMGLWVTEEGRVIQATVAPHRRM